MSPKPKPQAINYSVTREKAPVYTMGSPDARAYSRNKRGIAGSLIWINFDRHSLLNLIQQCAGTFVADIDEIRPQYTNVADGGAVFSSSVVRSSGLSAGATINQFDTSLTSAGQNSQLATPWYSDQVLPFDVTLSGANEYGAMCAAKIFGLEILNEGFGISIDDAVSEMQATFKIRSPFPLPLFAAFRIRYGKGPPGCLLTISITAICSISLPGLIHRPSRHPLMLCSLYIKLRHLDSVGLDY